MHGHSRTCSSLLHNWLLYVFYTTAGAAADRWRLRLLLTFTVLNKHKAPFVWVCSGGSHYAPLSLHSTSDQPKTKQEFFSSSFFRSCFHGRKSLNLKAWWSLSMLVKVLKFWNLKLRFKWRKWASVRQPDNCVQSETPQFVCEIVVCVKQCLHKSFQHINYLKPVFFCVAWKGLNTFYLPLMERCLILTVKH